MIVGIGTDIISIDRMAKNIERNGDAFAQRVLVDAEYEQYQSTKKKASFLAKRFAVKEAAVKALGTGFAEGITWKHVATTHDELGKPLLVFSGAAQARAEAMGVTGLHLSISDEAHYAVVYVVLDASS